MYVPVLSIKDKWRMVLNKNSKDSAKLIIAEDILSEPPKLTHQLNHKSVDMPTNLL